MSTMKPAEALAKMPSMPGTFTLDEYRATDKTSMTVAKTRIFRLKQDGLVVVLERGGRGTFGNPAIYQRTRASPAEYLAGLLPRTRNKSDKPKTERRRAPVRRMRTPAANSVFSIT